MKSDEGSIAGPHIALTFDVDGFSNWIGSLGLVSAGPMSRGEFEHIGLRRVLALLREYNVSATFFVPGSTAVAFPTAVGAIVEDGHEIGHHGWVHEPLERLSREQERRVLLRGLAALDAVLHVRPVGYRSPSWDNSPDTVGLLLEEGFEYDSSLMGNDVEPYWCRVGDVASQDEGFCWGTPVPLVEMPVGWQLDDHPYFARVEAPGVFNPGLRAPSSVLEIWRAELDFLCDVVQEGLLVFTFHPQVIGRGHLLGVLRALLDEVTSRPSLRFTTCQQYVRAWRVGREPQLPSGI
jgi:peptidoglycan/xylan/chitin deacetylase (PgdA/CDA1 family)